MTDAVETAAPAGPIHMRRNVVILAVCQALAMSGSSLVMTISALAGKMLATDPALATLPMALQFTATMLSTIRCFAGGSPRSTRCGPIRSR